MEKSFSEELDKGIKVAEKYKPLLIELCELFDEDGKEIVISLSALAAKHKISNILLSYIVEQGWLQRIGRGKYKVIQSEKFTELLRNPVTVFWILNSYYDKRKKSTIVEPSPTRYTLAWLLKLIKSLFNGK